MPRTIAIVEDETVIADNYAHALRRNGYQVAVYADRPQAMATFEAGLPALALVDIGLGAEPEGGVDLCRALRARSSTLPIIFLTARDSDLDAISGLRLGADDYLTKELSLPHLCARVNALFRRLDALTSPQPDQGQVVQGALTLDLDRLLVHWREQPVAVTLTEFWLIHSLARRPGHVKSRDQLMEEACIVVDDATITSHIKRIRAKFAELDPAFAAIDTVYGRGYRWLAQD